MLGMQRKLLWLASFSVVLCSGAFAQQGAALGEDCRVQGGSRGLLSSGYFQAVNLYRQGDHPAATDELLRTSSETIEETIDELEDVLKSSKSSLGDSCLQAAAMMHSEIEMLYAVKRNWERSKFHHESALKVVELMNDAERRERFRRDWLLSLAYFYQSMTVYEGEISSYVLAMTHFNEAVERFDDDAEVLLAAGTMYELGSSLSDMGLLKEAEKLYRRSIAFDPGSATSSGGRLVETDINDELEKVFRNVLLEIETRYLLTYRLLQDTEDGWHDIKVELENHKASIRARSGIYYSR